MSYPNYRNNRIECDYTVKKDIECGNSLIKVVKFSERYQFKHCLQNQ